MLAVAMLAVAMLTVAMLTVANTSFSSTACNSYRLQLAICDWVYKKNQIAHVYTVCGTPP